VVAEMSRRQSGAGQALEEPMESKSLLWIARPYVARAAQAPSRKERPVWPCLRG
jgi:hypothetical protein